MDRRNEGSEDSQSDDPGRHGRCAAIDGRAYTRPFIKRNKEDVLFRIPKTSYFRTRYREISMIVVHSSEIETKKSLILKEKRLDLLGR